MDTRILKKILTIENIEKMQKKLEEAELSLSIQKDIEEEADRKKKRELETEYILHGGD